MPRIEVGGIGLHYSDGGRGVPLVLVHGLGLDLRMWDAVVEPFAERYRVIRYDMRGHGGSDVPETGYSRADRYEELRALLDRLAIPRCHLLGLSMGGTLAVGFALRYPARLLGLVLTDFMVAGARLDPPVPSRDMGRLYREQGPDAARAAWLAEPLFGPALANPISAEPLRRMVMEHRCSIWRDPNWGAYSEPNDMARLSDISAPTLVLVGECELPQVAELDLRVAREIAGAEAVVVPRAGHLLPMEQPRAFSESVLEFLGRADAGLRRP